VIQQTSCSTNKIPVATIVYLHVDEGASNAGLLLLMPICYAATRHTSVKAEYRSIEFVRVVRPWIIRHQGPTVLGSTQVATVTERG
jgi:hypothetical protein